MQEHFVRLWLHVSTTRSDSLISDCTSAHICQHTNRFLRNFPFTVVRDCRRSHLLKMPANSPDEIPHIPQNGSVDFSHTLSAFSGGFHQQIAFFFLHTCILQFFSSPVQHNGLLHTQAPGTLHLGNSSPSAFLSRAGHLMFWS